MLEIKVQEFKEVMITVEETLYEVMKGDMNSCK